ncbi:putative acetyltransferase [Actinomadura pelletieri DSM 43383]|uniref:Putative acetyltransferase n=1 Tax=Actinomadura pelletieri DSM 43383 TaxID=1120940 RepID=A0A495QP01_9ACTN|nr:GNAT family N-acetyltransferase [Actinomadura pelletieri]RKS74694.1 putative acetyltransferase [Actinomadura pelletieri DSM 43383]
MSGLLVRRADAADRPVLERLWLMFAHDISPFHDLLPQPDGTFRSDRLDAAFRDPGWTAYLIKDGETPLGFAVVRGLKDQTRVMNSFFVVRGARRTGVGLRGVREVITAHPGHWEIPFQDDNDAAARFWRRVAATLAPDAWTEERRPIPGRPHLSPDVWISFSITDPCAG